MTAQQNIWPAEFMTRMAGWLGAEAEAFFVALQKHDVGLRLNPARGALPDLMARLPWKVDPVPWCPEGVALLEDEAAVGNHPYHAAGLYYIQDPSAMAAGLLLDPRPGEWILDLAAAPGGKSTHLGARMAGEGVLVVNEVSRRRASVLAMNVERMGLTNALVLNETPERLSGRWAGLFDAVLVDAPCSGEGMFSRDSRAMHEWSVETVSRYADRQLVILEEAARMVHAGGRILYGTCTFSPEEDEGVIGAFLTEHSEFEGLPLPALPGLYPAHPEWIGAPEAVKQCAGRFWPHTGLGHGHFYALLRRKGTPPDDLPAVWAGSNVPGRVLQLYKKDVGGAVTSPLVEEGLYLTGTDDLYKVPMDPALWKGLQVLRPGWWLGSMRHGKFNPDHALAMALRPEEVREVVDLSVGDPNLDAFFLGGFWSDEGPEGLVLVTVDGLPVGWAKRREGRCRSRYPVHLRRVG